jgi:hypothetical protein
MDLNARGGPYSLGCPQSGVDGLTCGVPITHAYTVNGGEAGYACETHLKWARDFSRVKRFVHREWKLATAGIPETLPGRVHPDYQERRE